MPEEVLLYEVQEQVAHITINRPKQKNSLNPRALELFHAFLSQAEKDPEVRAVLLLGSGEKAFCTGADLGNMTEDQDGEIPQAYQDYAQLIYRLTRFPKPILAKVKGYCLAGGLGLILGCDIVLAEEKAKFGTPEVNVGLFPMMIGALIFRNSLRKQAMDMILTGRLLSAEQACSMGLITESIQAERLNEEVEKRLRALTAKSPIGIRLGKEAFAQMEGLALDKSLDILSQKLAQVAATEDAKEGIQAFKEKRPPVFKGR